VPSGSLTLGPGQPRMLVVFATWLVETSSLRGRLPALSRYATAARGGQLLALAAVDEAATEPAAGAAAAYLKHLGKPVAYPVALDATGWVADGYGVQDQPWLVLVSASGKIVWKHDGWLSVHALEAASGTHA
jgi:hypothetical protein